jgi:hypothetical protein
MVQMLTKGVDNVKESQRVKSIATHWNLLVRRPHPKVALGLKALEKANLLSLFLEPE